MDLDLDDQRDSKGQMSFISSKMPEFPALVVLSNEIWNILDKISVPILQLHALTAIQQLQLYAIAFLNVLASNQRAVVKEATYNPLICYENFLWTKKQLVIFCSVVGRSSLLLYAPQGFGSFPPGSSKGAPMDVIHHSEIGTQHTMIEVMNHIKVLLKSTGRSEHSCSHYNDCVTAMMTISPGEIMCRVHIADQSDKASATKGIQAR